MKCTIFSKLLKRPLQSLAEAHICEGSESCAEICQQSLEEVQAAAIEQVCAGLGNVEVLHIDEDVCTEVFGILVGFDH